MSEWQPIETAPRGSPLFRLDGPLIEVRSESGHETRAYFGIGKGEMGPRWNDQNGLAMSEPLWWRRIGVDPLDETWACLVCFWKGRVGQLIAQDSLRCPKCSSSNVHPAQMPQPEPPE